MNALLQQGCDLILLFFLLSVLGWCMERIQAETAQNLDQLRQNAAYGLELIRVTPSEVQSEIIQKQDQLILCLEAGDAEPQQIQELHAEIQKKKQVLEDRKTLYHRR